jgi:predicted ATPase/transcriptional regulator with XRE-family HTH domain
MDVVTFGEWLKQRRKQLDLTQEALAGQVGCSTATLKKIEAGDRRPSRQIAELLARHLRLPAEQHATFVRVARGELPLERLPSARGPQSGNGARPAPAAPRTNLTTTQSALIGRERELNSVAQLLADPQCRLVTISGTGGVGKTSLALHAAEARLADFAHGVFAILLAPLNRTEQIVPAVAQALGFTFYGAADPATQLLNYLGDKHMLLVFDNCEHLLEAVEWASALLRAAPMVKLLATSRERLNLPEEWVLVLTGLSVPDDASASDVASVRLFVQAAQRTQVGFRLTEADRPHIVRICQLMDGLPLGIELAAAWVRTLTCAEIVREIEQGLDILAAPRRGVAERHKSLRAVFDHSWQLLSDSEREVFRRLAVFPGRFAREAAEAITGASLPALASLVDKSLLRPHDGRYDLHPAVRQFAAEKLDADPAMKRATLARHSEYYGAFSREREPALRARGQRPALEELAAEIENLRAGSRWAFDEGDVNAVHHYLDAGFTFYEIQTRTQEGLSVAQRRLAAWEARGLTSTEATVIRARLLSWLGLFNARLGRVPESEAAHSEALQLLRPLRDHPDAHAALAFGNLLALRSDYRIPMEEEWAMARFSLDYYRAQGDAWGVATALPFLSDERHMEAYLNTVMDSIRTMREIGDDREAAFHLNNLAEAVHTAGQFRQAREYFHESIQLSRGLNDLYNISLGLDRAGWVARQKGDFATARREHEESLALSREIGDQLGIAGSLDNLGLIEFEQGNLAEAQRLFLEGLAIRREAGQLDSVAVSLEHLARWHLGQGQLVEAEALLAEAWPNASGWAQLPYRLGELRLAQGRWDEARVQLRTALVQTHELGFVWLLLEVLTAFAELSTRTGNAAGAVATLAFVVGHPACNHFTRQRAQRWLDQLRLALTPADFAEAEAHGRALTLEAAAQQADG